MGASRISRFRGVDQVDHHAPYNCVADGVPFGSRKMAGNGERRALPKKMYSLSLFWRTSIAAAAVGFLLLLRFTSVGAHVEPHGTLRVQRPLMGTAWDIEVVEHGRPDAAHQAIDQAYAELERIDALMSEWKPNSPISQVNLSAGKEPVEVPEELRAMIERSIRYGEASE